MGGFSQWNINPKHLQQVPFDVRRMRHWNDQGVLLEGVVAIGRIFGTKEGWFANVYMCGIKDEIYGPFANPLEAKDCVEEKLNY